MIDYSVFAALGVCGLLWVAFIIGQSNGRRQRDVKGEQTVTKAAQRFRDDLARDRKSIVGFLRETAQALPSNDHGPAQAAVLESVADTIEDDPLFTADDQGGTVVSWAHDPSLSHATRRVRTSRGS